MPFTATRRYFGVSETQQSWKANVAHASSKRYAEDPDPEPMRCREIPMARSLAVLTYPKAISNRRSALKQHSRSTCCKGHDEFRAVLCDVGCGKQRQSKEEAERWQYR